jgi:hypothetical protein
VILIEGVDGGCFVMDSSIMQQNRVTRPSHGSPGARGSSVRQDGGGRALLVDLRTAAADLGCTAAKPMEDELPPTLAWNWEVGWMKY